MFNVIHHSQNYEKFFVKMLAYLMTERYEDMKLCIKEYCKIMFPNYE